MIKVKICGIQRSADALAAAEAGADFVGLVFVPERRRRLDLDTGREIVQSLRTYGARTPEVVGLFADQPLEEVNRVIEACQLDLAQLCGKESWEYCRQVNAQVIKVVHIDATPTAYDDISSLTECLAAHREAGNLVTLDRLVDGMQGGTGRSFDWRIAARLSKQRFLFLLAGGLSPDNVARAVAEVDPWAVDVSSGVETGGAKDPQKIRAFIANARASCGGRG